MIIKYKNEINTYLDIINNYKKKYWKDKEINSLKGEIKLLEVEYKNLLLIHRRKFRDYDILHSSFIEQKKDNKKI